MRHSTARALLSLGCPAHRHFAVASTSLDTPRITTWLDTHSFTRPPRASSLGHPARHHSVVHVFTTWTLHASPLGWSPHHHSAAPRVAVSWSPHHHLAAPRVAMIGHLITTRPPGASPLVGHLITTRPPRASSLGCAHHRPSATSRVTISWTCLYLYTPSMGTTKLLI